MNKYSAILLSLPLIANCVFAEEQPLSSSHPIHGSWQWTYPKGNCVEMYTYNPDNTTIITSGREESESKYTISSEPDENGAYLMTDLITKNNGQTGCDGRPGGSPIGDQVTVYVFFNPRKDKMAVCFRSSMTNCIGPFNRIEK